MGKKCFCCSLQMLTQMLPFYYRTNIPPILLFHLRYNFLHIRSLAFFLQFSFRWKCTGQAILANCSYADLLRFPLKIYLQILGSPSMINLLFIIRFKYNKSTEIIRMLFKTPRSLPFHHIIYFKMECLKIILISKYFAPF